MVRLRRVRPWNRILSRTMPEKFRDLEASLGTVLLGKSREIRLLVTALLADGHVLIEDVPGTGKTTLARALAVAIGADFRRVQFTPDLLPTDLTGGAVYRPSTGEFEIRRGPLFAQVFLADEINRASPRTQSALLEAMEERQVTLEGTAHPLPDPFLVLATQNPVEFHGVFPLPEAQMDRFLIRLRLGYPDEETEREISRTHRLEEPIQELSAVVSPEQVTQAQRRVRALHVDPSLEAYAVSLVRATRDRPDLRLGASPRAGIALVRAAQAFAFLEGRDHVLPDDIQELLVPVLSHRIHLRDASDPNASTSVLEEIRRTIPVPR